MYEFVWHWTNGDKKIFTRNTAVAEQALKDGFLVMGKKIKPHIMRF